MQSDGGKLRVDGRLHKLTPPLRDDADKDNLPAERRHRNGGSTSGTQGIVGPEDLKKRVRGKRTKLSREIHAHASIVCRGECKRSTFAPVHDLPSISGNTVPVGPACNPEQLLPKRRNAQTAVAKEEIDVGVSGDIHMSDTRCACLKGREREVRTGACGRIVEHPGIREQGSRKRVAAAR